MKRSRARIVDTLNGRGEIANNDHPFGPRYTKLTSLSESQKYMNWNG